MTNFLRHEPCPSCGSRDNLGVWDDGHTHCFGCGHWTPPTNGRSVEALRNRMLKTNNNKNNDNIYLPNDCDYALPVECVAWLRQYELTDEEIKRNRFMWSDSNERLIFPVFGEEGQLLLWQGRDFGREPGRSKYYTKGLPSSVLHVLGERDHPDVSCIILTEDLISAIKVSRHCPAMPIWGSHIPLETIVRLAGRFKRLGIWLDRDKLKESLKFAQRARAYFDKVSVIVGEVDPKDHLDEEIKEKVNAMQ